MKILQLLDIEQIAFTVYQYPVSYVEFTGTLFGLIAVWLATRQNILTWGLGLVNIVCFFAIFYQVRLYADMLLQVYFFATNLYGWFTWRQQQQVHRPVGHLTVAHRIQLGALITGGSGLLGSVVAHLHLLFPTLFTQPAAFPYTNSFTTVASVVAAWLLARRIIENWGIWVLVNLVCVYIYARQAIVLVALEYVCFLALAIYGWYAWRVSLRNTHQELTL